MYMKNIPKVTIISERDVLHKVGIQGERIGKVVVTECEGVITTLKYWYGEDGKFKHVTAE